MDYTFQGKNYQAEMYWTKPKNKSTMTLIIDIPGHVFFRQGATFNFFSRYFLLQKTAEKYNALVVSVSQPGYGLSDGPPDFCGPHSQYQVQSVIDYFLKKGYGKKGIILRGESRGAITSMMVAGIDSRVSAFYADGGVYDFKNFYKNYGEYYKKSNLLDKYQEIQRNIKNEAGTSIVAMKKRSPLSVAENVRAKSFIIHGEDDEVDQKMAKKYHKIISKKSESKLLFVTGQSHILRGKEKEEIWFKFLDFALDY